MIETLSEILNQGLAWIVPMIVLLGLLIFVHELGHFLAAKFFKVKVETFSLGFGPKIIKYVRKGTTYCVSAIPLGGYVKMFGDEPGKDIPEHLKQGSFLHKPVGQRIIIALAGPLMNLFFAGFLFYALAYIGDKAPSPQVGEITSNTMAAKVGFQSYDVIRSVNGQSVETWDQFQEVLNNSADMSMAVEVERSEGLKELTFTPVEAPNENLFSTRETVGAVTGLTSKLHVSFVGLGEKSSLRAAGLEMGDHITSIGDHDVKRFREIEPLLRAEFADKKTSTTIKVKRFANYSDPKSQKEMSFSFPLTKSSVDSLHLFVPDMVVAEVQKDSPAFAAGIKKYDRLLRIDGHEIMSFEDIVKNVSSFKPENKNLEVVVSREGREEKFSITPKENKLEGQYGETEVRYTIGVIPLKYATPETFVWKSKSLGHAVQRALHQTWKWTKITIMSFALLVRNKVSSKNLAGPIAIGQIAHQSWKIGLDAFLKMMAIISINLFILNLLPVPILDGGHLVLFTLEAIKGSPVSLKKIEIAQQVGFIIILCLMAFALFNDVSRLFGS